MTTNSWLIAIDLDGTLLMDDKTITVRTQKTLQRMIQAGHHVVIATGRPARSAVPYYEILNLQTPLITLNGAYVFLPRESHALLHHGIPSKITEEVLQLARQSHVQDVLIENGASFSYYAQASEQPWNPHAMSQEKDRSHHISSAFGHAISLDTHAVLSPSCILIRLPRSDHPQFHAAAQHLLSGQVTTRSWSDPNEVIEVSPAQVSKASALSFVAQQLGIASQKIIAFGDEMNDIQMLQMAQVAVAMANANPHILPWADAVTLDCNHDGVAVYLEQHFFAQIQPQVK